MDKPQSPDSQHIEPSVAIPILTEEVDKPRQDDEMYQFYLSGELNTIKAHTDPVPEFEMPLDLNLSTPDHTHAVGLALDFADIPSLDLTESDPLLGEQEEEPPPLQPLEPTDPPLAADEVDAPPINLDILMKRAQEEREYIEQTAGIPELTETITEARSDLEPHTENEESPLPAIINPTDTPPLDSNDDLPPAIEPEIIAQADRMRTEPEIIPEEESPPPSPLLTIVNMIGLSPAPIASVTSVDRQTASPLLSDEESLMAALYEKMMPQMQVELSLWLRDALDYQAKQMLLGVMHQLKEDYEMLFSETLRESLQRAMTEIRQQQMNKSS